MTPEGRYCCCGFQHVKSDKTPVMKPKPYRYVQADAGIHASGVAVMAGATVGLSQGIHWAAM